MKTKKQAEENGTQEEVQDKIVSKAEEKEAETVEHKDPAKEKETIKRALAEKKESKKEKPKKEKAKKESGKKAAKASEKEAAKKASDKKISRKAAEPAFYIQYEGIEVAGSEIADKVKALWLDTGKKISGIKSMNLYVKPEEHAVYYVINEEFKGHIDL